MKIYDISQEVLSSVVYEGDPSPKRIVERSIMDGELYNLSSLFIGLHNGTHVDAPAHFFEHGITIEAIPLEKCVGKAVVIECGGVLSKEQAVSIVEKSKALGIECSMRILLKGEVAFGEDVARVFATADIYLLGVESQSCAVKEQTMLVHKILLEKGIVLLEGIRLDEVKEDDYLLFSAPICIKGAEGAPVRALLIKD